MIGSGGSEGPVTRTPVILLHGNNDTPFPSPCNGGFGHVKKLGQFLLDNGYAPREVGALGYQGDQCDLLTSPTNKSGEAHSAAANVPDLRAFVAAVLDYTGADQLDIAGHSLGGIVPASGCARTTPTTRSAAWSRSIHPTTGSSTAHRTR